MVLHHALATYSFKMVPLARTIFVKMIPLLARLTSTLKVPRFGILTYQIFAFSGPKFEKIFWFFIFRNYRSLTFIWPKFPKSIPLPRLNGLKLAKGIPLARLESLKKYILAGGTSPGTFTMEEPPPPPVHQYQGRGSSFTHQSVKGSSPLEPLRFFE